MWAVISKCASDLANELHNTSGTCSQCDCKELYKVLKVSHDVVGVGVVRSKRGK